MEVLGRLIPLMKTVPIIQDAFAKAVGIIVRWGIAERWRLPIHVGVRHM